MIASLLQFFAESSSTFYQSRVISLVAVAVTLPVFLPSLWKILKYIAEEYLIHKYRWINDEGNAVPGPRPNLPDGDRYTRLQDGYDLSIAYRKAYGRIYRIWDGFDPELVLTKPEDVAFYYKDGFNHSKKQSLNIGHFFYMMLGECVGLIHGEKWKQMRSVVDPFFHNKAVNATVPNIIKSVNDWVHDMPTCPLIDKRTADNGFEFPLVHSIKHLPFVLVAQLLYGNCLTQKDIQFLIDTNEDHEKLVGVCFTERLPRLKLYRLFPTVNNRRMDKFHEEWADFNHRMVESSKKSGEATPASHMYQAVEEGKLTMMQCLQTIDEILFTNIDVASSTLAWQLLSLSENVHVQEKLRKEVLEQMEACGDDIHSQEFQDYICRSNTYLHYVMLESSRMRPTSAYTLPEVINEEKNILGYRIPKGTSVIIDALALNHDAPVWEGDGHNFRPERFYDLKPAQYRYSLWRFGLGPRKCLGQPYGEKVVRAVLALSVKNYQISQPAGAKVELFRETFLRMPITQMIFTPLKST
ncbi:hypothetical protein K7432_004550 [Basidiobolus ranarum]|uniref:Cytochrome P450 n=1 Tax=Basidiobolus ranarum TaxID=34480 RepID=A0ABR2W4H7_9FUNG